MNVKLHERVERVKHSDTYAKQFLADGNFTVCLLIDGHKRIKSFGVAKRNPNCDEFDPIRGKEISLARAVKKL